MKIYTKTGDKGTTALFGGARVPKYHPRIEAYGTIDELNSWIGYLRDQDIPHTQKEQLLQIQHHLFEIGAMLAAEPGKKNLWVPEIEEQHITVLEEQIDAMQTHLPELKNFILPGGHPVVSQAHIARCVCRRAERLVVQLAEQEEISGMLIIYLNRLSDYLFILARFLSVNLGVSEIPWMPRKKEK